MKSRKGTPGLIASISTHLPQHRTGTEPPSGTIEQNTWLSQYIAHPIPICSGYMPSRLPTPIQMCSDPNTAIQTRYANPSHLTQPYYLIPVQPRTKPITV